MLSVFLLYLQCPQRSAVLEGWLGILWECLQFSFKWTLTTFLSYLMLQLLLERRPHPIL